MYIVKTPQLSYLLLNATLLCFTHFLKFLIAPKSFLTFSINGSLCCFDQIFCIDGRSKSSILGVSRENATLLCFTQFFND